MADQGALGRGAGRIAPYDPGWPSAFTREAAVLTTAFGSAIRLDHIGSTAVPGLCAKPIIDLLGAVEDLAIADRKTAALQALG